MTNVTSSPPAVGGTSGVAVGVNGGPRKWTNEIDIADYADTVTTGGYIVVLNVPADTTYTLDNVECVTAVSLDAATNRVDIGDSADDDEFVSNAATLTAGTNLTLLKTTGSVVGANPSADSIRLKLTGDKLAGGTADASGIIRFVGTIMDCSRNAPADT